MKADSNATSIAKAYDVPVWMVAGQRRPRLFRIRWALRRLTRYTGEGK